MTKRYGAACSLLFATAILAGTSLGATQGGLQEGTPDIKFAGPMTFGPNGILFVADTQQAAIYALDTGDKSGDPSGVKFSVDGIRKSLAGMLGAMPKDILINDMTVNPASGSAYLSVSRGQGPDAVPVIVRVSGDGQLSEVSLKKIPFEKAALPNAPAPGGEGRQNKRAMSITDLAFVDGHLFIAGLSNEEFASKLRSVRFPFEKVAPGTSVEIYHGAHGQFETRSPVRTFVPYLINGESHLLAAYTCTPLVKFRVSDLKDGQKVQGTTVAELGNGNTPLDMVVYKKDGKEYVLIANTNRGVMKVDAANVGSQEGIVKPVKSPPTAGLKYESLADWKGVRQLERLNDTSVVILVEAADEFSLKSMTLP